LGGQYVDVTNATIGSDILRVTLSQLQANPDNPNSPSQTRLDWVGRNHGVKQLDKNGWDLRLTNFLYLDGHVETKNIKDTLTGPWQWGEQFYTLSPNSDVVNQ